MYMYLELYWHGGNLSYTSMILYIKTVTLKNDVPSKINNFQGDVFLKKILYFTIYIIDYSVCDKLSPYL